MCPQIAHEYIALCYMAAKIIHYVIRYTTYILHHLILLTFKQTDINNNYFLVIIISA